MPVVVQFSIKSNEKNEHFSNYVTNKSSNLKIWNILVNHIGCLAPCFSVIVSIFHNITKIKKK